MSIRNPIYNNIDRSSDGSINGSSNGSSNRSNSVFNPGPPINPRSKYLLNDLSTTISDSTENNNNMLNYNINRPNDDKYKLETNVPNINKPSIFDNIMDFITKYNIPTERSSIYKTLLILLSLLLFLIIFNIGSKIIIYNSGINKEPMLIEGITDSDKNMVISSNPNIKNSIPILRSINQRSGIEYTWSCWFYIDDPFVSQETKYKRIFSKGVYDEKNKGLKKLYNNSPGLYLNTLGEKNCITIVFTTYSKNKEDILEEYDICNIPIKKWVNCIITLQHNHVDVYINGIVKLSKKLKNVPVQNYYDTFIGDENGFKGMISDVRYKSYAINYSEVQEIFLKGHSEEYIKDKKTSTSPPRLSMDWYSN